MNILIYLVVLLIFFTIVCKNDSNRYISGISVVSSVYIKAVCSLVIIFHHLSFQFKDSLFFLQFSLLGTIAVAVFFFLSGYGLMKQAIKCDNYYTIFLSKRFSKLLPPFLIATICYTSYSVLVNGASFVWNRFINGFPPLPTSWFVYSISWFYLSFYVIGKFTKNINYQNVLMFVSSILYCIIVLLLLHWGGWWVNAIFAFNIGMFICSYEARLFKILKSRLLLIFTVLSLSVITLLALFLQISPIYNLTICSLLWMAYVNIQQFKEVILLKFIGKISYEIYLVQGAIIALLVRYLHIECFQPISGTCLTVILTLTVALGLQFVSNFIIKKYFFNGGTNKFK